MVPQGLIKWNASGNWFCMDSLTDLTKSPSFLLEMKAVLTNTTYDCVAEKNHN